MKKQNIIEWIVLSVVLVFVIPILISTLSRDGEDMFAFFRIQIRYINPITVIGLIIIQFWRKRRRKP
jgi:ACR3 family arsenite efflux pump ArsB